MMSEDEIAVVVDRARERMGAGSCIVLPNPPDSVEQSLTDGWRNVGWLIERGRDRDYDVWWHAERQVGVLWAWERYAMGRRPRAFRPPSARS